MLRSFGEESGLPFGAIAIPFESILVDLLDAQSVVISTRALVADLDHARTTKEALERTLRAAGYSMTVQLVTTANLTGGATGTLTMSSGANPSTPQPPVTLTLGG